MELLGKCAHLLSPSAKNNRFTSLDRGRIGNPMGHKVVRIYFTILIDVDVKVAVLHGEA